MDEKSRRRWFRFSVYQLLASMAFATVTAVCIHQLLFREMRNLYWRGLENRLLPFSADFVDADGARMTGVYICLATGFGVASIALPTVGWRIAAAIIVSAVLLSGMVFI